MAASDFFSRWAKIPQAGANPESTQAASQVGTVGLVPPADPVQNDPAATAAPPTLEQARQLTPADDFRAFVRPDVAPEVRNTAMKRLFADPHFNLMDGMDVYIDDYNKPDPLPTADLARMASAHFLRLIHSEPEPGTAPSPATTDGAASTLPHDLQTTAEKTSDDPDLRLQPNPEPGHPGTGSGAV